MITFDLTKRESHYEHAVSAGVMYFKIPVSYQKYIFRSEDIMALRNL